MRRFESFRHETFLELWQTWCMRRTENPENVVRLHEVPQEDGLNVSYCDYARAPSSKRGIIKRIVIPVFYILRRLAPQLPKRWLKRVLTPNGYCWFDSSPPLKHNGAVAQLVER